MLIVIIGAPGTGKTTVSTALGNHLHSFYKSVVFHIEIDNFRKIILGDENFYNEKEAMWFDLVIKVVKYAVEKTDIIIVEGLFYNAECLAMLRDLYPDAKLILLKTSLENCLIRNQKRNYLEKILSDGEIIDLYNIPRPDYLYEIDASEEIKIILLKILNFLGIS